MREFTELSHMRLQDLLGNRIFSLHGSTNTCMYERKSLPSTCVGRTSGVNVLMVAVPAPLGPLIKMAEGDAGGTDEVTRRKKEIGYFMGRKEERRGRKREQRQNERKKERDNE